MNAAANRIQIKVGDRVIIHRPGMLNHGVHGVVIGIDGGVMFPYIVKADPDADGQIQQYPIKPGEFRKT